jgi:hypothetical protein
VGNPPGHVAPRRHALRTYQICDIIERDHVALATTIFALSRGHSDQQVLDPTLARHADFLLRDIAALRRKSVEQSPEFWHSDRDMCASHIDVVVMQNARC